MNAELFWAWATEHWFLAFLLFGGVLKLIGVAFKAIGGKYQHKKRCKACRARQRAQQESSS